ncbi:large ribosomal subunit protein uL16m [Megalopta genalis]|uniref:large ribosomal subunit protein uL16m n=1 Tax=Megalopta genalis TaxID=115081 RepID=UPI003FD2DBD2
MQTNSVIMRTLLSARTLLKPWLNPGIVRMNSYAVPISFKDIEIPERKKLKVYPKVPIYPHGVHNFRMQKKLKLMRGPELHHNTLLYKQYGIVARGGGRLKHCHYEVIRYTLLRTVYRHHKDVFAIWRVPEPWQPITKKSHGMRMGRGKGGIDHYATPVKSGQILVEVGGPFEFFEVKKFLKDIANKMPFAAEAVSQEMMEKAELEKRRMKEENLNPWVWKYIIQNNMLGCHKWISKYDKKWFMEYL